MKKLILLGALISIAISGCKVDVETPVNLSDLNKNEKKVVLSTMLVEVPNCADFEDSRNESRSLIKAKKEIADIFPKSNFVECYKQGFNDYASFTTPVNIGTTDGDINIYSGNDGFKYISISKRLQSKIQSYKDKSIGKINPSITIKLKNDTNSSNPVKMSVFSVYLNGDGFSYGTLELKNNSVITLKLSDASMDSVIKRGDSMFMLSQ